MSTLYTNLPYVNETPDIMRNDLNMLSTIKIKLLRAGMFSLESLSNIVTGSKFAIKGIDVGVDRSIHVISKINEHDLIKDFRELCYIWKGYLMLELTKYRSLLSTEELSFLINRLDKGYPTFVSLEVYAPGEYVIRV